MLEWLLTTESPEVLLLWARQVGKTTGFACKATHHPLFNPKTLTLIVSATQRQAGILQRRATSFLRDIHRKEKWRHVKDVELPEDPLDENSRLVRCSVMSLELANGSEVISIPADPDTARGYSPHLLIVDEAARVPDSMYYGALRPMRSVTRAQMLAGSSAGRMAGWFYEGWTGDEGNWEKSEVKATDSARIAPRFLEIEQRLLEGKGMAHIFRAEYHNEFYPLGGGLFTAEQLQAMTRHVEDAPRPWLPPLEAMVGKKG